MDNDCFNGKIRTKDDVWRLVNSINNEIRDLKVSICYDRLESIAIRIRYLEKKLDMLLIFLQAISDKKTKNGE